MTEMNLGRSAFATKRVRDGNLLKCLLILIVTMGLVVFKLLIHTRVMSLRGSNCVGNTDTLDGCVHQGLFSLMR